MKLKIIKKSLLSVTGFFIRLNKGVLIAWFLTYAILGIAYGSIYGDMNNFLESSQMLKQMFTLSGVDLDKSFSSTLMEILIDLVAILPIVIINRLYTEESKNRIQQIYATKVSKSRVYLSNIVIAILAGVIGILLASLGLGSLAIASMNNTDLGTKMLLSDFIKSGFNLFPIILFFVGISGLAIGFNPKLCKLSYVYLIYSFILNYYGEILNIPAWLKSTSIQSFLPSLPAEKFDIMPFFIISLAGVFLTIIGYVLYKKRDSL